ncbi:hypothetical protein SELMODRAFT_408407 [Selaginella moellendorffii]|uniref:Uncharacterized protein n=1 Tax=Selaginella moellendorffii TaxID=88036 RepID=D8R872_SELML|nr:hypothetical protein SELMODRAFT_408407 [Selaginella moellendorffii]
MPNVWLEVKVAPFSLLLLPFRCSAGLRLSLPASLHKKAFQILSYIELMPPETPTFYFREQPRAHLGAKVDIPSGEVNGVRWIALLPEALPFMEEKIDVMGNELATSFGKYGFCEKAIRTAFSKWEEDEPYIDGERPIEVFKSKFRLWLANYTTTMVAIRLLAAGEGNFAVFVVDEGKSKILNPLEALAGTVHMHILDGKQFLVLAHRGKAVENVMALPSLEIARQLVAAPEGDASSLVAIVLEPQSRAGARIIAEVIVGVQTALEEAGIAGAEVSVGTVLEDAAIAGAEVSVGTVLEDADIAGAVVAVGTVLEDANIAGAVVAVPDDLQSWMHRS